MLREPKGNMYPGVETWNPLGGECSHKCSYCSTNSLKKRYEAVRLKYSGPLKLYLNIPIPKTDEIIFVCGTQDLFANEVNMRFINDIIHKCHGYPEYRFLFQTKNPGRFGPFLDYIPHNSILCTTIETNRWYEQMGLAPVTGERAKGMHLIAKPNIWGYKKQVTIEPIMNFDLREMIELIEYADPDSVNIGADSKGNHLPEPSKEKIIALIDELKKFTVINQKRNLIRLLK